MWSGTSNCVPKERQKRSFGIFFAWSSILPLILLFLGSSYSQVSFLTHPSLSFSARGLMSYDWIASPLLSTGWRRNHKRFSHPSCQAVSGNNDRGTTRPWNVDFKGQDACKKRSLHTRPVGQLTRRSTDSPCINVVALECISQLRTTQAGWCYWKCKCHWKWCSNFKMEDRHN